MIELTRLNGTTMVLNSDLIKTAEASPDTMLTLINGEKLIVRESLEQIVERVMEYRAQLLAAISRQLPGAAEVSRMASLSSVATADLADSAREAREPLPFRGR